MSFEPTAQVENTVVLVTDRSHSRFGQLGRLLEHDWMEYGIYVVGFSDKTERFNDGLCKGDPKSPVRVFYGVRNEKGREFDEERAGPFSLIETYLNLGFDLKTFAEKYETVFGEPFR